MPVFRARVPYYGLVDWPRQQVDRYALRLHDDHLPRRRWWPWAGQRCSVCLDVWPCQAYRWADGQVRNVNWIEAGSAQ